MCIIVEHQDGTAEKKPSDGILTNPTAGVHYEAYAVLGLRASLVFVFLLFGIQKFTDPEARGITEYTLNSPLTAWITPLGCRNVGRIFGVAELSWGTLLGVGFWRPGAVAALLGATGSTVTYAVTLSFLLTTPGIFVPGQAPILGVEGLFLCKDVVLLAASLLLLAQGFAKRRQS